MHLATLFALLRQYWRPVVAVHLIFTLLGIAVLSPLFGMLLQGVINLSGITAVVDQDIAHVLLSPIGMLAGVLLLAVLVAIAGLELGAPAVVTGPPITGLEPGATGDDVRGRVSDKGVQCQ